MRGLIKAILTLIGSAIFIFGSYYMGNFMMNTFNERIQYQIISSIYGILSWAILGVVGFIIYVIYFSVSSILNKK